MVNSEDFAKRLQVVMDYYGLTSSALADAIEFNRSSISHLLSGRNKPSLEFVMKILDKFPEVKLYWLLNGKGDFPETDAPTEKRAQKSLFDKEPEIPVLKIDSPSVESLRIENKDEKIDRIIIFYKDGTFKEYKN
jgi:transcriptional regulator with XRE-family HTH domain